MNIKNIIISSPAYIVPALINFAALIVFTRSLSLEAYGMLSLTLVTIEFLQVLLYQWIKQAMLRFYDDEKYSVSIALRLCGYITMALLVLTLVAVLGNKFLHWGTFSWFLVVMVGCFSRGMANVVLDYVRISRPGLRAYTTLSVLVNFCYYVPAIVWVLFKKNTEVDSVLYIQVFSLLVLLAIISVVFNKTIVILVNTKPDQLFFKKFLLFAFPLIPVIVASNLFVRVDRYIIEVNAGLTQLGAYSAAYSLSSMVIASFFNILTLPTYPNIIRHLNQENITLARKIFKKNGDYIMLVAIPLLVLVFLYNNFICTLLFKDKALVVAKVFPVVVIATFLHNCKIHYFDQVFQFLKKTKQYMVQCVVIGVVHLLVAFEWSKYKGCAGVAYSTMILNVCAMFYVYFFSFHSFKIELSRKAFFIATFCCMAIVAVYCFTYTYYGYK
ncbi:Membrane protein involved in the export of O-antigen and teichoic acid [Filimonas lacunae]|uniref:Membrane protein involved in the export of O-antigen and teichoic acid n=1 Tax=Filimonas lacunae TaxID=477680 RepID=A0A173MNT5_9BACT|nr:lipopolysaccharide biosynthesis protein [Filimonas lacunae]BAV09129.1 polysaccharide biosynthesis protein [Filimonas lacunae]SIS67671.1 Membrane protein involved in the export of O-antigen and teichoic acid [Filimonas lacunae]